MSNWKANDMTPSVWYKNQRNKYIERYNEEWAHLYIWPPTGHTQSSEACETALRSGIECRILQANSPSETEAVVNAILIRDYLRANRNTPYSECTI